jgi:nicotinamide-nucleotide amidase
MTAIILSVGDELALGQVVDTNSAWISAQLAAVGCAVRAHVTVSDSKSDIEHAIREAAALCDVLIISGGIGPTEDDLTRQALSSVMNAPLELNEQWLVKLEAFFTKLGRVMPQTNKIQAMIPRGARMIDNSAGTAAGIEADVDPVAMNWLPPPQVGKEYMEQMFGAAASLYELTRQDLALRRRFQRLKQGLPERVRVFVMPGVPKEMKAMFTASVLPWIKEKSGGAVILSKTLHTFGPGESTVAERLGKLMDRSRNPSVGTTVSNGYVSLRVNSRFNSPDEARRELDATEAACREVLGDLIFGADDETLPAVLARMLVEKKKTVATAESCTGGLLAKYLTDIAGSSAYFKQGWVTYTNESKQNQLGVPMSVIEAHGAVSEEVVHDMAQGARKLASSDFAMAISGVAGPSGGTPAKPVGMVCIALAGESSIAARMFMFHGDREMIRDRSAKMALTMLRYALLDKQMTF